MRRAILPVLVVLNLGALAVLIALHAPGGHGAAESVSVDELKYGMVDVVGDGAYTWADDYILEWFRRNRPDLLEEAARKAKRNPDGGIDLSPYLLEVSRKRFEESVRESRESAERR